MSILKRCPSYRESNKESKERQGPTLGVHLSKRESTYIINRAEKKNLNFSLSFL